MIYFVSRKTDSIFPTDELSIIDSNEELKNLITIFKDDTLLGLDTETNGLEVYHNEVLLIILGNRRHQIVIDTREEDMMQTYLDYIKNYKGKFVLHNAKFDYKMLYVHYNLDLRNMYDTMIADQRLYQGYGFSKDNPLGIHFNLKATLERRLPVEAKTIEKDTTLEFVGVNKETHLFTNRQIIYAAKDVAYLVDIYKKQRENIEKEKLEYLIDNIEMPLIRILGQAEVEGFDLDEKKWLEIEKNNVLKKYELELECDQIIKELREQLNEEDKKWLKNGKYDYIRPKPIKIDYTGLFGERLSNKEMFNVKKKKINIYNKILNYGSSDQLILLFGRLKQLLPTKSGDSATPIVADDDSIVNDYMGFTTAAKELETFLKENPNVPTKKLIENIIEINSLNTKIDTFGENFILNFKNNKTGRVHTVYRQCDAITGRLQSGKVKEGYYNSQNIPAEKPYRNCFIAPEGQSTSTHDLSGAETVIIASKSQDKELFRMAIVEDDIHSPLATAVWRHIFLYRAGLGIYWENSDNFIKLLDTGIIEINEGDNYFPNIKTYTLIQIVNKLKNINNNHVKDNVDKYENYLVTKKQNKEVRTIFKNSTFGTIYGMHYKKAAKTLSVSFDEGKIMLYVIKAKIPDTFRLVENFSKEAISTGKIIFNTKTNSRMFFPEAMQSIKYKRKLDFMKKHEIESAARNAPIQGTQADMIKEAIVEIQKYIDEYQIDCKFKKSIHDEVVYRQPLNMDGHSEEYKKNPVNLKFLSRKGVEMIGSFPELVSETMQRVANSYLTNIEMKVESEVLPYWTK